MVARLVNFLVPMWVYQYLLTRLPAEEFAVLLVVLSVMLFAPLFFSFFTGGINCYILDVHWERRSAPSQVVIWRH
jgi:hypothetical protein